MKRGDEWELTSAGSQHLAGEERTDRVGDCVVDVEEVEVAELGDFSHAGSKSEIVWRELKQRITGDGHLVIKDAVITPSEAEGLRVGDEMYFVTGSGEFDAELGRDYSGAAVSGIAGDADAHCAALA